LTLMTYRTAPTTPIMSMFYPIKKSWTFINVCTRLAVSLEAYWSHPEQEKFEQCQTWYRAHGTETHRVNSHLDVFHDRTHVLV
jgi:hypothetical protein